MKRSWKWLLFAGIVILSLATYRSWRLRHPFAFGQGPPLPNGTVQPQLLSDGDAAVLLAPDGTLWAFGGHDFMRTETPIRLAPGSDWVEIAGTGSLMLATKADGSLWGWYRDFSAPPRLFCAPKRVGRDNDWATIAATRTWGAVALKKSGVLSALTPDPGYIVPYGTEPDAVALKADYYLVYILRRDGTLWSIEPGALTPSTSPGTPRLTQEGIARDWVAISAESDLLALKTDGSLWVGGPGVFFTAILPGTKVGGLGLKRVGTDNDWSEIRAGTGAHAARKRDGSWWMTAMNPHPQTLPTPGRWQSEFKKIPFAFDPWAFAITAETTILFARDGSLWTWGKQLGVEPQGTMHPAMKKLFDLFALGRHARPTSVPAPGTSWSHRPRKIWQWNSGARAAPAAAISGAK